MNKLREAAEASALAKCGAEETPVMDLVRAGFRMGFADGVLWEAEKAHLEESDALKVAGKRIAELEGQLEDAKWATQVLPCDLSQEEPFDFVGCKTHDRVAKLGATVCDHDGLSVMDYETKKHMEQRARAVKAEMGLEDAQLQLAEAIAGETERAKERDDALARVAELGEKLAGVGAERDRLARIYEEEALRAQTAEERVAKLEKDNSDMGWALSPDRQGGAF